jgi:hypothetical protein
VFCQTTKYFRQSRHLIISRVSEESFKTKFLKCQKINDSPLIRVMRNMGVSLTKRPAQTRLKKSFLKTIDTAEGSGVEITSISSPVVSSAVSFADF